ncbi:protein of unknown function [Paraburkholderia dioscoreae]|uniref:Uncharacterized protein n=1 Tax=Paraburkholderia dioscoreae TaxID=2604047 RepID=A0A5Q4ZEH6_9BURK|nr:protein of unknown function [Paraburkholderia dioscoreae]
MAKFERQIHLRGRNRNEPFPNTPFGKGQEKQYPIPFNPLCTKTMGFPEKSNKTSLTRCIAVALCARSSLPCHRTRDDCNSPSERHKAKQLL